MDTKELRCAFAERGEAVTGHASSLADDKEIFLRAKRPALPVTTAICCPAGIFQPLVL
jgi:hypothetical protein